MHRRRVQSVQVDRNNNLYFTGYFDNDVMFDTTHLAVSSVGYSDIFYVKSDSTGQLLWAKKAGNAVVELGGPLADAGGTRSQVTGFSILQADSVGEIEQILKENPHRKMPSTGIEIHELLEIPGMSQDQTKRELEFSRR